MTPSAVACRLTILWMGKPAHTHAGRQLSTDEVLRPRKVMPSWRAEGYPCCYLHTLTFANPEPSYVEARKRWNSFAVHFLVPTGKWCVCVPQWGEKTGRLHFHLVSVVRWDADEMWRELPKYGFGRYDVRERPWSAACYAARYVGRSNARPVGLRGCRLWSVVNAKLFPHGVSRAADCKMVTKRVDTVAESPQPFCDWLLVRFESLPQYRVKLRPDGLETGPTRMNEINTNQQKIVLGLVSKGGFVGVGEYRSCVSSQREMADFKDKSKKDIRIVVEHRIEFAGDQKIIGEILPVGAKLADVVPPAKSGEMVAFVARSSKTFNGVTTWKGEVVSLAPAVSGGKV